MRELILATLSLSLLAAAPAPSPAPEAAPSDQAADAVTHHSLALGSKTLSYTARAGTITLRDSDEKPSLRWAFLIAFLIRTR